MQTEGLSGISFPFRFNGRGGVAVTKSTFTDAAKVHEQVIVCISTMLGERVMMPEYGTDLRTIPFEILNQSLKSLIRFKIVTALARWVPSIEVNKISIEHESGFEQEARVFVTVDYTVTDLQAQYVVTVPVGEGG